MLKNWIKKLLQSIEAANKQNFGTKRMDCCDLNKNRGVPKESKNR